MNITPNSFSDGGKFKKPGHSLNQFSQFLKDFDMVDVGAESTAPFNAPIDAQTELSRLEAFFYPLFEMVPDPQGVISLDTYRPEVFYEAAMWIRKAWPKTRLIFNDVSGKVDDDLLELFKEDLSFDYVLSHNLCPERDLCSDHMQYCHALEGEEFARSLWSFFNQRLESLAQASTRKVIIDPCFGFSKTRSQNHWLLANFERFLEGLPQDCPVLAGLSRKSFLRFPKKMDPKKLDNQVHLDCMQGILAFYLLKAPANPQRTLIFRTHSIKPFVSLNDALKILRD